MALTLHVKQDDPAVEEMLLHIGRNFKNLDNWDKIRVFERCAKWLRTTEDSLFEEDGQKRVHLMLGEEVDLKNEHIVHESLNGNSEFTRLLSIKENQDVLREFLTEKSKNA